MVQFFETIMGKRFFEAHVPKLLRELEKLNENLAAKNMTAPSARENDLHNVVTEFLSTIYNEEIAGCFAEEALLKAEDLTGYQFSPKGRQENERSHR